MAIYGNLITENTKVCDLSDQEVSSLVFESMMNLIDTEVFSESDEEFLNEGANIEITKEFMNKKKEYKSFLKEAKQCIKSKDYDKAKKAVSDAKKVVKEMKNTIEKTESTVGSAVFGCYASGLVNALQLIIPISITSLGQGIATAGGAKTMNSLFSSFSSIVSGGEIASGIPKGLIQTIIGSGVSFAGAVVALIKGIIVLIKDIKTLIERIDSKKEKTADYFNLYKNKIIGFTNELNKSLEKLEGIIDKAKKEEQK